MEIEIKNKYSDADVYAQAVCQPIPRNIFVKHMRDGVEKIFSSKSKTHLKVNLSYVHILEGYLDKYKVNPVVPDERFFDEMWDRMNHNGKLNGKVYSLNTTRKVARAIRKVVNEYFYPKRITKRKVLLEVERQRYERFFSLTKLSQKAVKWFEENGKIVKAMPVYVTNNNGSDLSNGDMLIKTIHRITDKKLLPVTNSSKIQLAMLFLRVVGKNGFEHATDKDVKKFEEYCDERKLKKKQDYLADVATFFINIHGNRFIKNNPFANISLRKSGESVRKDFIPMEDIDKFRDLSTVNYKDKTEVRDRLMALLAYDLAMRINEFLALKVSDFRKDPDGEWHVLLRSEIQKGHKDEDIMYFFFDETKELLEAYLKIRNKFSPKTEHFFVSRNGEHMSHPHCRIRFKELCAKFNVKTFYGKSPSPHCLRHSFATLNIEPLGLSLPLYEIMQRLRHTRFEVAKRHYIHNNPYLQKQKHKVYRKRIKKITSTDTLNEIPLPDLEHWLSDRLNVEPTIIASIRRKHKKAFSISVVDKGDDNHIIYIPEDEALERIKHLDISRWALREHALKKGVLADGEYGTCKYGKGFRYKEEFIDDLARNWVSAQSLRTKLKLPRRTFYRRVKKERWRILKIGKNSFIHREDCV